MPGNSRWDLIRGLKGWRQSAHEGGRVVSPTQGPPLPPGNTRSTHFCQRRIQPQGRSAAGRIMSMKNFNDTIGNRTRDLPSCSAVEIMNDVRWLGYLWIHFYTWWKGMLLVLVSNEPVKRGIWSGTWNFTSSYVINTPRLAAWRRLCFASRWLRCEFLVLRPTNLIAYYGSGLTLRWLMSYIYGAPILDVSRSHTTTQHSR